MKQLITALIELFRTTIAPFLSGWLIADTASKAKRNEEKANALEERVAAQNRVAAMHDGSSADELRNKWNRKTRVRPDIADIH